VTTPDPSADADLFDVLSAISIIGPDNDDVLWVSFKNEDELGAVAVRADTIAGHAVAKWQLSPRPCSCAQLKRRNKHVLREALLTTRHVSAPMPAAPPAPYRATSLTQRKCLKSA
jgi:hypothetical protein